MKIAILILSMLILSGCGLVNEGQKLGVRDIKRTATPSFLPNPGQGRIEGQISFPSEKMPDDLNICAENETTKKTYCSDKKQVDETDKFKVEYSLTVPAGKYLVYGKTVSIANYKAYYSDYVKCGMKVDCNSHKAIVVEVKANETTKNIDPNDWYNMQ